MRKQLFLGLVLAAFCMLPFNLFAQSTQGTDFWVTFMRAMDDSPQELSLSFSTPAKKAKVTINNEATGYLNDTITVYADSVIKIILNTNDYNSCYVANSDDEVPSNKAFHITADSTITIIAANYRDKSFDVAAIMPTKALRSEYFIQCYRPTNHNDNQQGSHFAVIATEDNTTVDILTTERTNIGKGGFKSDGSFDTITTTLDKGQVYYVWTGAHSGESYDLSGSKVFARNNKKIAVFNGNPHTNVPDNIKDRDHLYSQAMPIEYWGTKFAITSSLTTIDNGKEGTSRVFIPGTWERIDKIRVMALEDGTTVYIDGKLVHKFDLSTNRKRYYEFDFGKKDELTSYTKPSGIDFFEGSSHYIETSCPCAVHLFLTSNQYDHKSQKYSGSDAKYCNGDPSLIWVNPIEQTIKDLTFGTFQTQQVKDHFINVVTPAAHVKSIILDSVNTTSRFGKDSLYKLFDTIPGNKEYMFARLKIDHGTHHLTSDSGFIAHAYGFGIRESYGFPAGGDTKDLTAFNSDNVPICDDDNTIIFGAELNYKYDSIYWFFDDGKDTVTYSGTDTLPHFYELAGVYPNAYALIYRPIGDDDKCQSYSAYDSIHFIVNIGNYKISIDSVALPYCSKKGDPVKLTIYLNNPAGVSLTSDSVKLTFDAASKAAGFDESTIQYQGDTLLSFPVPTNADGGVEYGFHLHIGSECPNAGLDKDFNFVIEYDVPLLEQRYDNVLGLRKDSFPDTQKLVDLVWYHDGVAVPGQQSTILYLDESNPQNSGEYHVCYTIKEAGKEDKHKCTCPIQFTASGKTHGFAPDTDSLKITATYFINGQKVFVNADWEGKTDIECYAQWITSSGSAYQGLKFDIPDGGCTIPVPAENGFYILRVVTDGSKRSFKFIINH